jgi:diguanylate cyclase (GGDEF)-like protein
LEAARIDLPAAVVDALSPIDELDVASLEAGETIGAPARTYSNALGYLAWRSKLDLRMPVPTPGGPAATPASSVSGATTIPVSGSAPSPPSSAVEVFAESELDPRTSRPPAATDDGFMVAAVPAGALAVGTMTVLGRRRRRRSSDAEFDRVLEAGRKMTHALDEAEIGSIAVAEARGLAGARGAACVFVGTGPMRLAGDESGLFDERRLPEGILATVAETGRPVNTVVRVEPSVIALPSALLAVPVFGGGRVTGVLVLIRPEHRPFGKAEVLAVGRLAPMVGSALAALRTRSDSPAPTDVDALTGLLDRRKLDRDLFRALEDPSGPVGVAMVDVDHFQDYIDTNGPVAGGAALRTVAGAIAGAVRPAGSAYRRGGEEFTVLLRGVEAREAVEVAERMRAAVETCAIPGASSQPAGRLTISVGIAVVRGGDPTSVLMVADRALHQAKREGRNTVVLSDLARSR